MLSSQSTQLLCSVFWSAFVSRYFPDMQRLLSSNGIFNWRSNHCIFLDLVAWQYLETDEDNKVTQFPWRVPLFSLSLLVFSFHVQCKKEKFLPFIENSFSFFYKLYFQLIFVFNLNFVTFVIIFCLRFYTLWNRSEVFPIIFSYMKTISFSFV